MTTNANLAELLGFLDYLSDKGLMKDATVASRRAVVNKVFEVLDDEDRADVLSVDTDDAMTRFINKAGSNYSPGSLQTYKSRLSSTIDDFRAYRANPMGFRPTVSNRAPRKKKSDTEDEGGANTGVFESLEKQPTAMKVVAPSADILPIPIRADLVIRVQGLPFDLTRAEASKISAVINAYVAEE